MSRCFPYPPPGFEKGLASIEPIKLQKEEEKAKKERKKERKREKKEKKEKAGRDKERAEAEKRGHKRHHRELSQSTQKTGVTTKTREEESEQLEKSSLTEEQGGPAAVQSLCDSYDSTQNSCKRSKDDSAGAIRFSQGNGLRIRLPLSRHRDTESSVSSEGPCFSGRTEAVPTQQEAKAVVRHGPPPSTEQPCFSERTGATPSVEFRQNNADGKPAAVEPCRVHRSGRRSSSDIDTRRLYRKLILEWNPPPPQAENPGDDDRDWLFGKTSGGRRRQQGEGEARGAQVAGEAAGLGGAPCSWPPRACLLPEVGMFALPYVVPF